MSCLQFDRAKAAPDLASPETMDLTSPHAKLLTLTPIIHQATHTDDDNISHTYQRPCTQNILKLGQNPSQLSQQSITTYLSPLHHPRHFFISDGTHKLAITASLLKPLWQSLLPTYHSKCSEIPVIKSRTNKNSQSIITSLYIPQTPATFSSPPLPAVPYKSQRTIEYLAPQEFLPSAFNFEIISGNTKPPNPTNHRPPSAIFWQRKITDFLKIATTANTSLELPISPLPVPCPNIHNSDDYFRCVQHTGQRPLTHHTTPS
jgi:hypothetical protein